MSLTKQAQRSIKRKCQGANSRQEEVLPDAYIVLPSSSPRRMMELHMGLKTSRQTNGRKIYQGLLNPRYHLCSRKFVRCRLPSAGKINWESNPRCLPFTTFPRHLLALTSQGGTSSGNSQQHSFKGVNLEGKTCDSQDPESTFW